MPHLKLLIFNSALRTGWEKRTNAQKGSEIIDRTRGFNTRHIYLDECFEMDAEALKKLFSGVGGAIISSRETISFSEQGITKEEVSAVDVAATRVIHFCLERRIPLFGICYGLQIIGRYFGERIEELDGIRCTPTEITLTIAGQKNVLFEGVPTTFDAPRKHGNAIISSRNIEVLARDKTCIQAIAVPKVDIHGVQFHPHDELNGQLPDPPHLKPLTRFIEMATQ